MSDLDTIYARWLSGDLSETEVKSLKESGEWKELEAIIKATDELTLPKFNFDQSFKKVQEKKLKPKTKLRIIRRSWVIGVAASVLLLVGYFGLFYNSDTQISAANTQNTNYAFGDDSQVILNDGSSVSFNENQWENGREVKLKGEAYFDVSTTTKSFAVTTSIGQVEVLGTQFNVRAWGNILYVACYEGRVRVTQNDVDTIVEAGNAVTLENGEIKEERAINNTRPAWMDNTSDFDYEDLNEVFREVERQFNVKIKAPKLNRPYGGQFSHKDLVDALEDVCKPSDLSYSFNVDSTRVTISE